MNQETLLAEMNQETLLAEMNRVLDQGEPLLTLFHCPGDWLLKVPDNISHEMRRYADEVAWRAYDRKGYLDFRQRSPHLAGVVKRLGSGLLGWRAIGVLK